jgi:hypothetical protein
MHKHSEKQNDRKRNSDEPEQRAFSKRHDILHYYIGPKATHWGSIGSIGGSRSRDKRKALGPADSAGVDNWSGPGQSSKALTRREHVVACNTRLSWLRRVSKTPSRINSIIRRSVGRSAGPVEVLLPCVGKALLLKHCRRLQLFDARLRIENGWRAHPFALGPCCLRGPRHCSAR